MTLPCPNCGARLRVIADDPELQRVVDDYTARGFYWMYGAEEAAEKWSYYLSPQEVRDRCTECPACHGLCGVSRAAHVDGLEDLADRWVEIALVLAPDAQPER